MCIDLQNHVHNSLRLSQKQTHTQTSRRLQWSGPHSLLQSLSPKPPESMPRATLAVEIPLQPLQKEKADPCRAWRNAGLRERKRHHLPLKEALFKLDKPLQICFISSYSLGLTCSLTRTTLIHPAPSFISQAKSLFPLRFILSISSFIPTPFSSLAWHLLLTSSCFLSLRTFCLFLVYSTHPFGLLTCMLSADCMSYCLATI